MDVKTLKEAGEAYGLKVQDCIYRRFPTSVHTAVHTASGFEFILKVKTFPLDDSGETQQAEIESLAKLTHPGVVGFYGGFWFYSSESTWEGVLILEHMDSDLWSEINKRHSSASHWSDLELLEIAYTLLDVFSFCELEGVCHRDIKPQNIFCGKSGLKVGDFGISKASGSEKQLHTVCGSTIFLSPILRSSIVARSSAASHNAYKSDVYSLGVTLLCLCILRIPTEMFATDSSRTVLPLIDSIPYCDTVKALIKAMLEHSEENRPSFSELQRELASVMDYPGMCRHVQAGLATAARVECHGDLCEYCSRDSGQGVVLCRVCMTAYNETPTAGSRELPPGKAEKCVFCGKDSRNSPYILCESGHKPCSDGCLVTYCRQFSDLGCLLCPACGTTIPERVLSLALRDTEIEGVAVRCVQCKDVTLATNGVLLQCNCHCYCNGCRRNRRVDVGDDCPACSRSLQSVTQPCSTCHSQVRISEIFTFECGHLICSSCYPPSPHSLQRCQFCLRPCSICGSPLSQSELKPLKCGHFACANCCGLKQMCGNCAVHCGLCMRDVGVEETIPLECGKHSVCIEHLIGVAGELECRKCGGNRSNKG